MENLKASKFLSDLQSLNLDDMVDKKKAYESAREFMLSIEDPHDTINRIVYSPLVLILSQIGGDLNIFEILNYSKSSKTTFELAQATGTDEVLLRRILRYLCGERLIKEVEEDTFTASNLTEALSRPGFQAGIQHSTEALMPCFQHTPQFLKDISYQNPGDVLHSPFQIAHKTNLPAFVWAMSKPKLMQGFNLWMKDRDEGRKTWLDVVVFEQVIGGSTTSPETPIFVDIGGGVGHQCAALRAKLPHIKGRVILQDLPLAIQYAEDVVGADVEKTVFDFWGEQPVKEAKAYYLRNILHDYPDDKCVLLLKNTIQALGSDSVILIDEMIIPDKSAHRAASATDMVMMTSLAAMERSKKQWIALLTEAGLKVRDIFTYSDDLSESVIVAVPV